MIKSILRTPLYIGAAIIITSCATPTHLIFHQNTVLGVDAATTAQGGNVHIVVGYDRQTTAFVPKTTVPSDKDPSISENEAMSAVSLSTIKVKGLGHTEVHERFATGIAAVQLAGSADQMQSFATSSPSPSPKSKP